MATKFSIRVPHVSGRAARAAGVVRERGLGWPSEGQGLLLRALVAPPSQARASYLEWRGRHDLALLDRGSARLLALAAQRLKELGLEDAEVARLNGVARHTWTVNQLQIRAALGVVDELARIGVESLALKGLVLTVEHYDGDFASRPMYDVDLLVRPASVVPAARRLIELGWSPVPAIDLESLALKATQMHHAHSFKRGSLEIDLHWHVVIQDPSPYFDQLVWEHARAISIAHRSVRAIASTELLIHTCLHGTRKNTLETRVWPIDAIRILSRGAVSVDWDRLLATARERAYSVALEDALRFLSTLTDAVPARVLEVLLDHPVSPIELLEHRAIVGASFDASGSEVAAARRMAELRRAHRVLTPELLARQPIASSGTSLPRVGWKRSG